MAHHTATTEPTHTITNWKISLVGQESVLNTARIPDSRLAIDERVARVKRIGNLKSEMQMALQN
jgi:hypothetical protein